MTAQQLLLFGALCAATHWIIARSEIARPFWSRVPRAVDALLRCAGCSGFWLGMAWCATLYSHAWRAVLVAGVLGAWITPVFEGVLLWGLEITAIERDEKEETTPVERPS